MPLRHPFAIQKKKCAASKQQTPDRKKTDIFEEESDKE